MNEVEPANSLLVVADGDDVAADVATVAGRGDPPVGRVSDLERVAERIADRRIGGVVVGPTATADLRSIVEHASAGGSDRPVVAVVDEGTSAATAMEAGATATLPAAFVRRQPRAALDRALAIARDWRPVALPDGGSANVPGARPDGILDAVPDLVAVLDPDDGEILRVNDSYVEFYGTDRESLVGREVDSLAATDPMGDGTTPSSALDAVLEGSDGVTVEWEVETAAGERRWLATRLSRTTVDGEELVVTAERDVTDRKDERLDVDRAMSESLAPTSFHDPETGAMVEVSAGLVDALGYDDPSTLVAADLPGVSPSDDESVEDLRSAIRGVAERMTLETVEWTAVRPDGERVPFQLSLAPGSVEDERIVICQWNDVSERRMLERTYREVFEGVSDGLVVHEPESGRIVDVNDRYCEMMGYDREDLVGATVDLITDPDADVTYDQARERIRKAGEEGPQLFEWPAHTADGETYPAEVHLSLVEIRGKERVLASVRDVTERKRRQREYEQIFDGVTDAIAVHDPETGEILEVNRTYADLLGYDRETLVDLGIEGISDVDAGYTVDRARESIDRVLGDQSPDPFEWAVLTAEGERRWFEVELTEATVGGERRVLGISRDVTERRERQRAIAEEREKYSTLVEQSTDGVAVVQDGEYAFVNDRFAEITGYDVDDLLGTSFERVFTPEYRDLVTDRHRKRVAGESPPNRYDVEVEQPDGTLLTLELAVSRITHEGEPATLANFRDVTERRERERKLERTQKQFRQIAEAVDEVIHLAAPDLSETYYLSPAYEDIWGRPVEEMYEDPFSFEETVHPEDREEFLGFLDRVTDELVDPTVEERDVYGYDYRVERDDGEVRWIEGRLYPIRDEDGEVIRIVSINRDTTEARRRRQTLESFQDATAELTTAESTAEACRTAVSAAAEVFDLGSVAVHLFDEESGVLDSVAASDRLGPVADLPSWSADDGAFWEAFVDERPIRTVSEDARVGGVEAESALVLPLAGHGVLTVWADEDEHPAETAHLVAATLEGALNHLVGKRRLESQREELEAQTERADQMERIAELNRRVEAAITGQSNRIAVERAVCERLVDIDPFVAAWTAEVSAGSDRLTPRTTAGVARESVEQALVDEGGVSGDHPVQRAWRSSDVVVETDLVGRRGWRRDLLRRGVQSLCAIPLSYEGIEHGVLVVHATDASAFEGPVLDTLEQLGTSIGYAITAIERRRALESDETIELEFRDDDASMPFARLAEETDCQVRHDRTVRRQDGSISVVYTVIGDVPDDVDEVARNTLPGEVAVVSRDEGEVVLERDGTTWFGSIVSEYGGVLRRGHATPERTTLVAELPTEANTRRFVDRLEETIPGIDLYAQRQHRPAESTPGEVGAQVEQKLSDRQLEALETAHEMGYFDWPRENSGQAVAEAMGITQPTLNKHLRVAERKLVDLILGDDRR